MPGFVKTPKDEARWAKAKEAAGKETEKGSEGYWKLSNYIFHKMGKTEEDKKNAQLAKEELFKFGMGGGFGGGFSMNVGIKNPGASGKTTESIGGGVIGKGGSNPMKAGTGGNAAKTPKAKKPADPFGKPSLFFKNEDSRDKKQSSISKLKTFLEKAKARKQS